MSMEIELKLRLPTSQAPRLLSHPLLAAQRPQRLRLFNTYYDTPDRELRQRGLALRLRRAGSSLWLMTVKGGDAAAGGLARRSEWEAPTEPGVFDFSIVSDDALRRFLDTRRSRLQAIFTTDFTRTAWTLERGESRIELALDRGAIKAGSALAEPLCEVELELIEGRSPDALFDLAIALAADLHLHPEIRSKAERGYLLADAAAQQPAPVKSFISPLGIKIAPVEAFRSLALACLVQLQRNEAGAIAGRDVEYVHQARVAIRRLRSAMQLFSPRLEPAFIAVYSPRWRELAGRLGEARDLDVFLSETLVPLEAAFSGNAGLAVLRTRAEARKTRAQESAGRALQEKAYSQLLLAFSAALFRQAPPTIGRATRAGSRLRKFASRRLEKRARAIVKLFSDSGTMNAECRHELRIEFKKLRYAIEFFAPLLSTRRLTRYQNALSTIQSLLGTLNDQATALCLIEEMHPESESDSLARGWIAGRSQLLVSDLASELRRFLTIRKPWR